MNKTGSMKKPWSSFEGAMLTPALIHEFGHVFGFQHSTDLYLMSENFLEEIFAEKHEKADFSIWVALEKEEYFLKYNFFRFTPLIHNGGTFFCVGGFSGSSSAAKSNILLSGMKSDQSQKVDPFDNFFGIDLFDPNNRSTHCFSIQKRDKDYIFRVTKTINDQDPIVIGEAVLQRFDSGYNTKEILKIWLPKEQRVFQPIQPGFLESSILVANFQEFTDFKGNYKILSQNKIRPFNLTAQSFGRIRFGGELNGTYYINLISGF